MTDWLAVCRAAAADVEAILAEMPPVERQAVLRQGEGGDDTTAIDEAAERAILARLEGIDDLTIVSEEIGIVGSGATRVVVDPIDGSLNSKRGIPFFSLSIAVADGPAMGDVHFGYVYDFGTGEEWVARKGEGATLNDASLGEVRPKD